MIQDLVVKVTRTPFSDFFLLSFTKNGRVITEELECAETSKWFMERFTKAASVKQEKDREEAVEKALDECWNFYETNITIPADVYREPTLPFPKFQPQV